jgi:DNA polymerase-1
VAEAGADPWLVGDAGSEAYRAAGEAWGRPPRLAADGAPRRPWALLVDATAFASPDDLKTLFAVFGPRVKSLARSGRLVVVGRAPEDAPDPAVAATGRLSSSDPNLQNIPVRTAEGRRIRAAFIAPPGKRLVAADYSQIELRIMAHLSRDERLLDAFGHGQDVHRATAAEVFGVEPAAVTADQRRSAKAINFGLIYGMSAFGLARQLGIERGAAQRYVNLYFERYPGVKRYMDDIRAQAHEQGYVETVFGRRLYLPEINSRNVQRRQYAERTAINAPMQGTAADIIKLAMIAVDDWLLTDKVPAEIIMQVHDELVLEVEDAAVERVKEGLRERMSAAAELAVRLEVDVRDGMNWDEAH